MIGGLFLNSKSRTQYSAYNTSIALFSRAAAILMGYVVRVVFTHVLSENYVGINGLFTDILNVLSLSEMGIETAISFALYKPIADGNTEAQKSIMHLYQWFYRFVAVFVAAAGICVIPFMDILIKNKPDIPHLTYIYILYLFTQCCLICLYTSAPCLMPISSCTLEHCPKQFHGCFRILSRLRSFCLRKILFCTYMYIS